MSDNVKFINSIEKLLHEKEGDYGHFDHTSFAMAGMMEKYLSVHNNKPVKVPLKFFGLFMISLKCWRIMQSKEYKKDSFDDINGYTELLRRLVVNDNKTKRT
jgi:hypothetical protein